MEAGLEFALDVDLPLSRSDAFQEKRNGYLGTRCETRVFADGRRAGCEAERREGASASERRGDGRRY